jgi:single-strand DNA-binding protein
MYQHIALTGRISSPLSLDSEGTLLFNMESIKVSVTDNGIVKSRGLFTVHVTGRMAQGLATRLETGNLVSVRGYMTGNEFGSPEIIDSEDGQIYASFDLVAVSVKKLAKTAEDEREDELNMFLLGHLGRDPEMRFTPSGLAVTNINLATNYFLPGSKTKGTVWWRLAAWGTTAENVNKGFRKGSKILVEASPTFDEETGTPRVWTTREGEPRASYEGTVFNFRFVDSKEDGAPLPAHERQYTGGNEGDEEIPF